MKLYYFGLRGRAETPRLMMKLGGKDFEDIRFSGEEWGAKYKAMSPGGGCPWLVLDDGRVLSQSAAVNLHCAEVAGFLPADPFQVARTVELLMATEEIFISVKSTFSIQDEAEKLEARKALCAPDGVTYQKMKAVEALIAGCTTPFYCGDAATLADIHLFCWSSFFRNGFLAGIDAEFFAHFEKTLALRSKVASMPKVKEMYTGVAGFEP